MTIHHQKFYKCGAKLSEGKLKDIESDIPFGYEWDLNDLQNSVVCDDNINQYYKKNSQTVWQFNKNPSVDIDEPNEQWRECSGCYRNGFYGHKVYASNYGRIGVLDDDDKLVIYELYESNYPNEKLSEKLLSKKGIGYLKARKENNLYGLGYYVYQLVADAWIIKDHKKDKITTPEIHHITNDGYDNRPNNLIRLDKTIHETVHNKHCDPDYKPGKYDYENYVLKCKKMP